MRGLENHAEVLADRALVGAASEIMEQIDMARQRLKILKELCDAYRTFLSNASSSTSLHEFRSIMRGETGCNTSMLSQLVLPTCMLEDLLGLEAAELVDNGEPESLQRLHKMLQETSLAASIPTTGGGHPVMVSSLQQGIYTRLVTRILRARGTTVESAREQIHALLGPLVGMPPAVQEALAPTHALCLSSAAVPHTPQPC